jgi:hypothetical protein
MTPMDDAQWPMGDAQCRYRCHSAGLVERVTSRDNFARMPKVKGAHVLAAVKMLRSQRERALTVLPARVHKYLEERILASMWYPFEDHIELLRGIGTILGGDPWPLMGRGLARMDLSGLYKHYLRPGDPAQTMQMMGPMWKSAHDSGEITVTREATGRVTMRLRGFIPRSAEICGICTGYLMESVSISSRKEPRVAHATCRVKGANECIWTVTWPET